MRKSTSTKSPKATPSALQWACEAGAQIASIQAAKSPALARVADILGEALLTIVERDIEPAYAAAAKIQRQARVAAQAEEKARRAKARQEAAEELAKIQTQQRARF